MFNQFWQPSAPLSEPVVEVESYAARSALVPYSSYQDLKLSDHAIVYGVVVDFTPVSKTKGTDFSRKVQIIDPTSQKHDSAPSPSSPVPLSVNLFHPNPDSILPGVQEGDVVCLSVKIQRFNGKLQGLSLKGPRYFALVIDPDGHRSRANNFSAHMGHLLRQWYTSYLGTSKFANGRPLTVSRSTPERQFMQFDQLTAPNHFFDACALVLTCNPCGDKTLIFLTDFTENSLFRPLSIMPTDWIGTPSMIFPLTLWDEHASVGANLRPGDFVCIRNVRTKMSAGEDGHSYLEGALHGERGYRNSSPIHVFDGPLVDQSKEAQQILRRKRALETLKLPCTEIEDETLEITSFHDVLTFPKVPFKFRCRASAVDYLPSNMNMFCRSLCPKCLATYSAGCVECVGCERMISKSFTFCFSILLTDGSAFIPIIFYGDRAQKFLGLKPCNLEADGGALSLLQNRLSRLFTCETVAMGSDASQFTRVKPDSSKMFDLCIFSYRPFSDGPVRYMIFDTIMTGDAI